MKRFFLLFIFCACATAFAEQILPEGWIDSASLEAAEQPIQEQLDTGVGMNQTAWSMAAVKDARLLLTYVELFQALNKAEQLALLNDQKAWLLKRQKAVKDLENPDGGSIVSLDQATAHMKMTDARQAKLARRLSSIKKSRK